MRSKLDLKRVYPELHNFFCSQLRIQVPPNDILYQELVAICRSAPAISSEDHEHLCHILEDISDIVRPRFREKTVVPPWISKLVIHPIFPVRVAGTNGLQLRKLNQSFYIPDISGMILEMFGTRVDVLELIKDTPLSSIGPLLKTNFFSDIESRYLDFAVACKPASVGERIPDIEIQEDFLRRADLIQR
jgi:hypothetical protein